MIAPNTDCSLCCAFLFKTLEVLEYAVMKIMAEINSEIVLFPKVIHSFNQRSFMKEFYITVLGGDDVAIGDERL